MVGQSVKSNYSNIAIKEDPGAFYYQRSEIR